MQRCSLGSLLKIGKKKTKTFFGKNATFKVFKNVHFSSKIQKMKMIFAIEFGTTVQ